MLKFIFHKFSCLYYFIFRKFTTQVHHYPLTWKKKKKKIRNQFLKKKPFEIDADQVKIETFTVLNSYPDVSIGTQPQRKRIKVHNVSAFPVGQIEEYKLSSGSRSPMATNNRR